MPRTRDTKRLTGPDCRRDGDGGVTMWQPMSCRTSQALRNSQVTQPPSHGDEPRATSSVNKQRGARQYAHAAARAGSRACLYMRFRGILKSWSHTAFHSERAPTNKPCVPLTGCRIPFSPSSCPPRKRAFHPPSSAIYYRRLLWNWNGRTWVPRITYIPTCRVHLRTMWGGCARQGRLSPSSHPQIWCQSGSLRLFTEIHQPRTLSQCQLLSAPGRGRQETGRISSRRTLHIPVHSSLSFPTLFRITSSKPPLIAIASVHIQNRPSART